LLLQSGPDRNGCSRYHAAPFRKKGQRSHSGHERAFAGALNQVGHRVVTRRSSLAVGNAAVLRPRNAPRRTHALCQELPFAVAPEGKFLSPGRALIQLKARNAFILLAGRNLRRFGRLPRRMHISSVTPQPPCTDPKLKPSPDQRELVNQSSSAVIGASSGAMAGSSVGISTGTGRGGRPIASFNSSSSMKLSA
jgi:hypothetical protein